MLSLRFPITSVETTNLCPFKSNPFPSIIFSIQARSLLKFHKPVLRSTTESHQAIAKEGEGRVVGQEGSPEEEPLPAGLRRDLMPKHVAVIMDGSGRWARERGLPEAFGHKAGCRRFIELVNLCCEWGIKVLTVFAFSNDNWIRSKAEVSSLMEVLEIGIISMLEDLVRKRIRLSVIGDSSKLPECLQRLIKEAEESTKTNSRLEVVLAMSYSGHYDIAQACKKIAGKVKDGLIELEDISKTIIEQELETNCTEFPYPDLLIRTSGELRISNFLLWQLAYTELLFVQELWPDFGEAEFIEALCSFQQRQRRYGGRFAE